MIFEYHCNFGKLIIWILHAYEDIIYTGYVSRLLGLLRQMIQTQKCMHQKQQNISEYHLLLKSFT